MSKTKKLFLCFSVIICGLLLVTGCDSTKNDTSKSEDKNASEEVLKKDIPEGEYNDMGNGEFYVSTPSGTSENGNIPVFFVDEDTLADKVYESGVDLGINAGGFDGSKLSTIYVDGISQGTEQLADTQTSLFVSEKLTTVGVHKVEVLQFDDNNNVVTYKSAQYEIKTKKKDIKN